MVNRGKCQDTPFKFKWFDAITRWSGQTRKPTTELFSPTELQVRIKKTLNFFYGKLKATYLMNILCTMSNKYAAVVAW